MIPDTGELWTPHWINSERGKGLRENPPDDREMPRESQGPPNLEDPLGKTREGIRP